MKKSNLNTFIKQFLFISILVITSSCASFSQKKGLDKTSDASIETEKHFLFRGIIERKSVAGSEKVQITPELIKRANKGDLNYNYNEKNSELAAYFFINVEKDLKKIVGKDKVFFSLKKNTQLDYIVEFKFSILNNNGYKHKAWEWSSFWTLALIPFWDTINIESEFKIFTSKGEFLKRYTYKGDVRKIQQTILLPFSILTLFYFSEGRAKREIRNLMFKNLFLDMQKDGVLK